jgi:hypothetical protein
VDVDDFWTGSVEGGTSPWFTPVTGAPMPGDVMVVYGTKNNHSGFYVRTMRGVPWGLSMGPEGVRFGPFGTSSSYQGARVWYYRPRG